MAPRGESDSAAPEMKSSPVSGKKKEIAGNNVTILGKSMFQVGGVLFYYFAVNEKG